ncbi:MAG: transposase [Bacteroidales bacterium]|nr:transposase [Bacteroidales bacterium]
MSTGYKIEEQDSMYFITMQIVGWVDLLTRQIYRDIIINNLKFCQQNKGLVIYGYVIMSNHIHLLAQSEKNVLSATIRDLKSFTSKVFIDYIENNSEESRSEWLLHYFEYAAKKHKRNSKYQIWTHENHAELIYTDNFINQKLEYIHYNPVKAGIVKQPEDYIYSSATNYAGLDSLLQVELLNTKWKTFS